MEKQSAQLRNSSTARSRTAKRTSMSTYLVYSILALTMAAAFIGSFCAFTYYLKVEQEMEAMKASKAETVARKNALLLKGEKARIYLKNTDDPEFKRREIRQNLGVAAPDEIIVDLQTTQ